MFEVMEERCDECLFDPVNRIVTPETAADLIAQCLERANESHFICHKSTIANGGNVCCHGFYKEYPNASQLMQVAGRMGWITFVPVPNT